MASRSFLIDFIDKRDGKANIRERLDKAICFIAWSSMFPQATVFHHLASNSDHCSIQLDLESYQSIGYCPFCFIKACIREHSARSIIDDTWLSVPNSIRGGSFLLKLKKNYYSFKQME